jgi:hypothetical protein
MGNHVTSRSWKVVATRSGLRNCIGFFLQERSSDQLAIIDPNLYWVENAKCNHVIYCSNSVGLSGSNSREGATIGRSTQQHNIGEISVYWSLSKSNLRASKALWYMGSTGDACAASFHGVYQVPLHKAPRHRLQHCWMVLPARQPG